VILVNEIDLFFTHAMPLIFRVTVVYVLFSVLVCLASSLSPAVSSRFESMRAKTLPFFVIAALLALTKLA